MENSNQTLQAQEVQNQMPPVNSSPGKSKVIPIVLGIAAVVAIAIGAYVLGTKQSQPVVQSTISPTPLPAEASATEDIPSPTTDPTANWNVYSDTEGNFSVKYPVEWSINKSFGEIFINKPITTKPVISIQLSPKDATTLKLVIDTVQNYSWKEKSLTSILVSGVSATKISGKKSGINQIAVIFEEGKYIYKIQTLGDYVDEFDQILSTFQFTQ